VSVCRLWAFPSKLLGQRDHSTAVISLIDLGEILAAFNLHAGSALAVTSGLQLRN